jgi:hypothetical protein
MVVKDRRSRLPSHSTVAAYVALVVAVGTGGAWAAGNIGSDDIAKNAVLSKHIKGKQVKASDIAQGAGVEAIAFVDNGGLAAFDPSIKERGFETVERDDTGVYCLTPSDGVNPLKDPAVVTVEYGSSNDENYTVMWSRSPDHCPDGDYEFKTYEGETGVRSDDAAFVVMVP